MDLHAPTLMPRDFKSPNFADLEEGARLMAEANYNWIDETGSSMPTKLPGNVPIPDLSKNREMAGAL